MATSLQKIALQLTDSSLSLRDGYIETDGCFERIEKFFFPAYRRTEESRLFAFLFQKIQDSACQDSQGAYELGQHTYDYFKSCSHLDQELLSLDHLLYSLGSEQRFRHAECEKRYEKWVRYGFSPTIFKHYPQFVDFLFKTPLASQMKPHPEAIKILEGEPALLVEGVWTPFSALKARFECRYSEHYCENFLYDKNNGKVYTYLGAEGLTQHHPYQWEKLIPTAQLEHEEHKKVLQKAALIQREVGPIRSCVLQIVSNETDWLPEDWNISKVAANTGHSYLRLIDETGAVYSIGFTPYRFGHSWIDNLIFRTSHAELRQPDLHEYYQSPKRIITSLPISRDEFDSFEHYFQMLSSHLRDFGEAPAFNFVYSNCAVLVQKAVFYATGLELPLEISCHEALYMMLPDWIHLCLTTLKELVLAIPNAITAISPSCVQMIIHHTQNFIIDCINFMGGLLWTLLTIILGEGFGLPGIDIANPDKPMPIASPLFDLNRWTNLRHHKGYLPSVMHKWQMGLPSTEVFQTPLKLAIIGEGR